MDRGLHFPEKLEKSYMDRAIEKLQKSYMDRALEDVEKSYLDRALEKLEKSYMDRGLHFPEKLDMQMLKLQMLKSQKSMEKSHMDRGLHFPEKLEMSPLLYDKLQMLKSQCRRLDGHHHEENKGVAVDIEETPKEYVFCADVPGLTKSDIQVYVEEETLLVIECQGVKRKRDAVEDEEGCKYLRVERKRSPKSARKFTLPGDANVEGISASCVDGVLTVTVPRIPPAMEFKTIQICPEFRLPWSSKQFRFP